MFELLHECKKEGMTKEDINYFMNIINNLSKNANNEHKKVISNFKKEVKKKDNIIKFPQKHHICNKKNQ